MPCIELKIRLTHQVTGWLFSAGSVLAYQVQAGSATSFLQTTGVDAGALMKALM